MPDAKTERDGRNGAPDAKTERDGRNGAPDAKTERDGGNEVRNKNDDDRSEESKSHNQCRSWIQVVLA